MPRDSQRTKLYSAERNAFNVFAFSGEWYLPEEVTRPNELTHNGTCYSGWYKDFSTIKEVQRFINSVVNSKFWKQSGGPTGVIAKPVPNRQHARAWLHFVEIPEWAYSKPVILHELAHCLTTKLQRSAPGHGPEFVLVYRRLIEQELGVDARRKFDQSAERLGVSWTPKNSEFVRKIAS